MSKRSYHDCLNAALRLLTRRDHSSMELRRKLRQRRFDKDHIHSTLAECERLDYVNDERFAHEYTRQLQRKHYGTLRIRQKLATKGLAARHITEALARHCHESAERDACSKALQKKIKTSHRNTQDGIDKNRLYRFLSSRGFKHTIIRTSMDDEFSP